MKFVRKRFLHKPYQVTGVLKRARTTDTFGPVATQHNQALDTGLFIGLQQTQKHVAVPGHAGDMRRHRNTGFFQQIRNRIQGCIQR